MQAKLEESRLEIDTKKEERQAKTEGLEKRVLELEKKGKKSDADHNLEIIKAQEEIGELRSQNEQLKKEVTKQENLYSELREECCKKIKDLESQNDELRQKCLEQARVDHEDFAVQVALDTPAAEDSDHIHQEVEQYKQQIFQLQSEIATSKAKIEADFDKQLTDLQKDIDQENVEKALEKEMLLKRIQAHEEEIRKLKRDKQALQETEFSIMKQLRTKEQETEEAIAKLTTQFEHATEENADLKSCLKKMEKDLQERDDQYRLLEGELSHLKEKTDEKQVLGDSNNSLDSLENSEGFEDAPESPLEMVKTIKIVFFL